MGFGAAIVEHVRVFVSKIVEPGFSLELPCARLIPSYLSCFEKNDMKLSSIRFFAESPSELARQHSLPIALVYLCPQSNAAQPLCVIGLFIGLQTSRLGVPR